MIQGLLAGGRQHACMSTCTLERLGRAGPVYELHAQLVLRVLDAVQEHAERYRDAPHVTRVRVVPEVLRTEK